MSIALGENSHAEGMNTWASGAHSHSAGYQTVAASETQYVIGKHNIADVVRNSKGQMLDKAGNVTTDVLKARQAAQYAFIVGNGPAPNQCSNAHTLDWNGNAWFAGHVQATKMIVGEISYGRTLPADGVEG